MVSIKKKSNKRPTQGEYWASCCCTTVPRADDFGVLSTKNAIQTKSNLISVNSKVQKQMSHTKMDPLAASPMASRFEDRQHEKQLEEVSPDTSFSDYSKQHVGGEWSAVIYTEDNPP